LSYVSIFLQNACRFIGSRPGKPYDLASATPICFAYGDLILDICGFLLPGFLFMTKLHLSDSIAILIVAQDVGVAKLLLLSVQKAGMDMLTSFAQV
jgi:hypothetical protein